MNKEGALLLILADKLNGYEEDDIRQLCQEGLGLSEPESIETTCRILLRWVQLNAETRREILKLVSASSLRGEDNEFTRRIGGAIRSINIKGTDPDKGQQAVA
ncbi:MAG: hypothetical protein JWO03_1693 [Bacteroidetes bacterium]|nr:hypothetical protein [Bacteroidota bacterium]